ncbi:MAG: T9SS type A sorting domain-containing protein [Bacteroidales bacterium]|nr:T9SS type A sorting domain-containing protein [Bacteroidales bacterium]
MMNATFLYSLMVGFAIFGISCKGYAQPVVNMPSSVGCIGHELLVPIEINEFYDIEAFSMKLIGDTSKIKLLGIANKNTALDNGVLLYNAQVDSVSWLAISWVGHQSVSLDNDTLLSIKLLVKDSTANISFYEPELVLSDYTIAEDAEFFDGNIIQWNNLNPEVSDNNPDIGESVNIRLPLLNGLNYQWQIKDDGEWSDVDLNQRFEGSKTHELRINEITEEMNGMSIRCLLNSASCSEVSEAKHLEIQTIGFSDLESVKNKTVTFYPNPANQYYRHFYKNFENLSLKLVDAYGHVVKEMFLESIQANESIKLPVKELSQGFYVLKLYEHEKSLASYKFIKNK